MDEPKIPHGYKRAFGQLQKGDGVWDGERFRKVRKSYPNADGSAPLFAIRKCEIVQTEIPGTEEGLNLDE